MMKFKIGAESGEMAPSIVVAAAVAAAYEEKEDARGCLMHLALIFDTEGWKKILGWSASSATAGKRGKWKKEKKKGEESRQTPPHPEIAKALVLRQHRHGAPLTHFPLRIATRLLPPILMPLKLKSLWRGLVMAALPVAVVSRVWRLALGCSASEWAGGGGSGSW